MNSDSFSQMMTICAIMELNEVLSIIVGIDLMFSE